MVINFRFYDLVNSPQWQHEAFSIIPVKRIIVAATIYSLNDSIVKITKYSWNVTSDVTQYELVNKIQFMCKLTVTPKSSTVLPYDTHHWMGNCFLKDLCIPVSLVSYTLVYIKIGRFPLLVKKLACCVVNGIKKRC